MQLRPTIEDDRWQEEAADGPVTVAPTPPFRRDAAGDVASAFAVLVVVAGGYFASHGQQGAIGPWGLVQALPIGYFACLGVLCLSFLWQLMGRVEHAAPRVFAIHLIGLVVLLHGAPALLEDEPRFPTAWLHAGFVGQILEHHVAPGTVDARFNWPGFFGAGAAVTGAGGLDSAVSLLRWAPVVMVLLYLVPLHLIGRQLTGSAAATWLGLWLFVGVNWVGQDYFAPQSFTFLLYLTSIAVLVTFFRETGTGRGDGRPSWPARHLLGADRVPLDGAEDVTVGPRTRALLVTSLLVMLAAVAMSHQLTPIVLTMAAAGLVLVGRCRLVMFPLVAGVVTLAWISVGTTDYWVGHLHTIFGGMGDVQSVVTNSVGERIEGSTGHLAVVRLRLGLTATVWLLMGLAAIGLWIRRKPPLTLLVLGLAPFLLLVQSYGSEGVLRIFLFSAPFACLLIGQWVAAGLDLGWVRQWLAVALLLLLPVFLVTRYGNESYEEVRSTEVSALRTLYGFAPQGSVFFSPTSQVPWRFEKAVQYGYHRPDAPDQFVAGTIASVRDPISVTPKGAGQTYLVVTRSQILYGHEALGFPSDWFQHLQPLLTPRNGYYLVVHNEDTWIYQFGRPS